MTPNKVIKRDEVMDFLRGLNGKFFTIEFIKRTDGSLRVMRATTNYQSKLVGGVMKYNPTERNLIPVLDLEVVAKNDPKDKGIRSIPTDAVLRITALGAKYEVV